MVLLIAAATLIGGNLALAADPDTYSRKLSAKVRIYESMPGQRRGLGQVVFQPTITTADRQEFRNLVGQSWPVRGPKRSIDIGFELRGRFSLLAIGGVGMDLTFIWTTPVTLSNGRQGLHKIQTHLNTMVRLGETMKVGCQRTHDNRQVWMELIVE
jgi:hypothetical protein